MVDHQTFKNSAMFKLQSMIGQWRCYIFGNSITRYGTDTSTPRCPTVPPIIDHRSSVSESTVTQLLSTYAPENQWKSSYSPRFPRLPQLRLSLRSSPPAMSVPFYSEVKELVKHLPMADQARGQHITFPRSAQSAERKKSANIPLVLYLSSNTYWKQSHLRLAEILRWTIELWFESYVY